jgi:hypothetical protein
MPIDARAMMHIDKTGTMIHSDDDVNHGQPPQPSSPPPAITIQAVLFDLDGTLLDTEALSDRACIQAFQQYGVPVPHIVVKEERLPWVIKKQITGLPGSEWIPMVLQFAQDYWIIPQQHQPPSSDYDIDSQPKIQMPSV